MKKRKFKLLFVPAIYVSAIIIFGTSMYFIERIVNNERFKTEEVMQYVDTEIVTDNEYIPVVNVEPTIMKPFLTDGVKLTKSFYNYEGEANEQENSIIVYQNKYMPNSGASYSYSEVFDITAILDGTVMEIKENELLGTTVKIRHNNDLISIYGCLKDVTKKEGDNVMRGEVIAKSGISKLYPESNNLHFELVYQGKNINPENSYNKTINEL